MTQLENALNALRYGFRVFPCGVKSKKAAFINGVLEHGCVDATTDEATIRKWWAVNPDFNPAVTGGTIIDADVGLNSLEDALQFAKQNFFPDTLLVRTGRRPEFGAQFHFPNVIPSGLYVARGVSGEIRGKNEYGMAPGAVHPNGTLYEIAVDLPRAFADENLLRGFRKKKPSEKAPTTGFKVGAGERFYWLRSQCGRLVNAGLSGDALFDALQSLNQNYCNPPKDVADVRTLADAATEKFTANVSPPDQDDTKHKLQKALDWIVSPDKPCLMPEEVYDILAQITPEEYEDLRTTAAELLGIRAPALDAFVAKRRKSDTNESDDEAYQKVIAKMKPSVPWESPVDGSELLEDTARTLRRFVVFKEENHSRVMACWTLGTHLQDEFNVFARLGFVSAFPDSGKTTCIDVLHHLCLRALRGDNISISIFYRVMETFHPVWLLDELDTYIHENKELVGVLNSGHKRGGWVWRNDKTAEGKIVPEIFMSFGPVSYAMLGHPIDTLFSRTIFIKMDSKRADQIVEDFDPDEYSDQAETMTTLRRKMARWAQDHKAEVKEAQPGTGDLNNRKRTNWKSLLKIAHVIGGDCSDMLLTAAGSPPPLNKKRAAEKILRDIRNVFHTRGIDRIPSEVLVADLLLQRDSGWTRYHNGREPLDSADLADLLLDFEIQPKVLKFTEDDQGKLPYDRNTIKQPITKRGYQLDWFKGYIEAHLPGGPETVDVSKTTPY